VLQVLGLWHGPIVMMGAVFLLFAIQRCLGSLDIKGGHCLIIVALSFRSLFLILPSIGGVGSMLSLCWVLVVLWVIGCGLSILLPSQSLVGPPQTRGSLG
jgi:hypothetical protein